ncbi:MAG: hypothetical protein JWN62_3002 [Acidimicrobiales bacterium]|nr:hypothetical protein [Acidimicrobiales bacterium]
MELDLDGRRILSTDECVDLLATRRVGRVALSEKALPTIVAEAYEVRGSTINLVAPGVLLLAAARRGDIVCFEADSADAVEAEFWSVVVVGRLQVRRASLGADDQPHIELTRDFVSLPMMIVTGRAAERARETVKP